MAQIPVVRMKQGNYTIYVGQLTVGHLLKIATIDEWDAGLGWELEGQGYQRAPDNRHAQRIGRFLQQENEPLLPTAALASARTMDYGILDYQPIGGTENLGYLELPEDRLLHIVDYQHRWRGFWFAVENLKMTNLLDFQIPVIIMADVPRFEEMRQFYLINSKQKRIDSDLALTLMQGLAQDSTAEQLQNLVGPGYRFRIRATQLTVKIAQMDNTPWTDRIAEPNIARPPDRISLKSFVDSLRPVLSVRGPYASLSDEEIIEGLIEFWRGIKLAIPQAFQTPNAYAIQGTVGAFVMHRVVVSKAFSSAFVQGTLSKTDVATTLSQCTPMSEGFWVSGGTISGFSSGAGHRLLANQIIGEIVP